MTVESLLAALQHPSVGRILIATFLVTFGFVGMEATFALLGERRFALDASRLGLVFVYVGLVIAVVQGGLIGRLVARFGERALATAGAIITGLSLLAIPFAPGLAGVIVVLGALALGQGLMVPTLSSLLSRESGADEQGGVLGISQSLAAAARAIGPLTAGWLFDLGESLPYLIGALLTLLAAWLVGQRVASRADVAALKARSKP
jgi:DHA1 family tetracycline resistance protein-like MFS transporter